MFNKTNKIELLAPAKDKECAITAINYGADAIYMGCSKFGARKNAGNTLEDIKTVVDYAHIFNAKVYVTINTILKDKELQEAVKTIHSLYKIGVDSIIIQDMGLLKCDLPPISLFASTQCNNNSLEKVKFLEQVGFKRVILARELSLPEIKEICDNTNVEIETFIHGALCVSYSGQCYLSYAIGNRSANRGECAQPCRKTYSLIDSNDNVIEENKHLLCLKDLNLSNHLEELILSGVTSFKIEGRLKNEAYVKNVVGFYRQKIDEILKKHEMKKSSLGQCSFDFEPDLNKTFNRGFTTYFLNERNKNITSFDTPKSIGEYVGKVIQVKNGWFKLDKDVLNNADGICLFDENNDLIGTNVSKVENGWVSHPYSLKIAPNTKIYRNYNHKFENELKNSKTSRKITVNIDITEQNNFLEFKITDEACAKAIIKKENTYETAQNLEKAKENLIKQFSKLNETTFYTNEINLPDEVPFIPISELNSIRRELIQKLEEEKIKNYQKIVSPLETKPCDFPEKELDFSFNIMNEKAKEFYEEHGSEINEMSAESGVNMDDKKIMTTKHCLRYSMDLCNKENPRTKFKEPFYLVDETGKRYLLKFDCKNCQMEVYF